MTEPLDGIDLATPPPPPLSAALEAELRGLRPAPPRKPWQQLGVVIAASIGWAFALAGLLHVRSDLVDLPRTWLVVYLAAWLIGFVAPLVVLVVPRRGSMMTRWRVAALLGGLAAIGFVVGGLTLARSAPTSTHYGLGYRHLCLPSGLAAALVPVLLAVLALRGAIPQAPRLAAAGLGAAAGCIGGFMLHLHCAVADGVHVGVVHGGVVVIAAGLCALFTPRWLAAR